jgi:putative lipoic acid-binding regulatory protein
MEPFEGVKLQFPVKYDLKVIMQSDKALELNEAILRNILNGLTIPHSNWSHRHSSEGKFVSFSVNVELPLKETMDALYAELRREPSVRWAM